MGLRLRQLRRTILGQRPSMVLLFVTPTLLAIALDFALRGPTLVIFPPREWLNYFGSSLASAGFWGGPLWVTSRLWPARRWPARVALGAFWALFVLPLAAFGLGGQILYYRVFHYYMGRDTVRLGIKLRGTLGAWMSSWGGSFALMIVIGLVASVVIMLAARKASRSARVALPSLPIAGFLVATACFWVDFVESRSLQAAPPDTCFIHGVMHALRDAVTGKGWVRKGISRREPDPLPPLVASSTHRPSVILVVSESVRADAMCSSPALGCKARFLDEVAPDRIALGKLTSQSSGTFSSCVMLWTGMPPDSDFRTMHHAAVLWEIARARGYRTAYIGSQNPRYDDFGAFLENAALDVEVTAIDVGGAPDPHVGAPDENATARMLSFVKDEPPDQPYFAVLHLSNTHWPYRVADDLQPNSPHDPSPVGDLTALHNHYLNSVLMQERSMAEFLRQLRELPGWQDTVVLFLSDHGEQFREHGGLYHLTSVFDEQVRVPGWLLAGDQALDAPQRAALRTWLRRRTYTQDIHATVLDLLGVLGERGKMPYGDRLTGRSLLRPASADEPMMLLSTASGVWEPDDAKYGVMKGEILAVKSAGAGWLCYDIRADPAERVGRGGLPGCGPLIDLGTERFKSQW